MNLKLDKAPSPETLAHLRTLHETRNRLEPIVFLSVTGNTSSCQNKEFHIMWKFVAVATGAVLLIVRRRKSKPKKTDPQKSIHTKKEAFTLTGFTDPKLRWDNGQPNRNGGTWSHQQDGSLTISPEPQRDYWSRTFYTPLLVKHDAQTLLATVPLQMETMVTVAFTLSPVSQFDQAGIMVKVDDQCWVKAGIEYTDGLPRLSCVVTNEGYSDWSTQTWKLDNDQTTTSLRVRVSKLLPGLEQGPSLVMEASPFRKGDTAESAGEWFQVRIASLRSRDKPWKMGVFAICPVVNRGASVQFHHIQFGAPVTVHQAENPLEGGTTQKL